MRLFAIDEIREATEDIKSFQDAGEIEFEGDNSTTTYTIRLADAAPDILIFMDERILFQKTGFRQPQNILLGAGRKESLSFIASICKGGHIEDAAYLRNDAGNDENSER